MRLNNRNKTGYFSFLGTLVLMTLVLGIIAFFAERYRYNYLGISSYLFLIVPSIFVLIYFLRGRQIFEYDSDGEALNFKNQNVVPLLGKPKSDEFPKYKLQSYEIINAIFFKQLFIKISSRRNTATLLKYDISYLTRKELHDLKFSLSKVIKANLDREKSS